MAELKHTIEELRQMQSLPLDIKIQMSCRRIREWYDYYEGDVYISFSGGKDSTVLTDLVKNKCGLKDVPVVFVDTGLEFPEIKEFAKQRADVVLRPEKTFKEVIKEYGYPVISKEVGSNVYYTKRYLDKLTEGERERALAPIVSEEQLNDDVFHYKALCRLRGIMGRDNKTLVMPNAPKEEKSWFNQGKHAYLLDADFNVSDKCCHIIKEAPLINYYRQNNLRPYIGTMADESKRRISAWLKTGCNAFELKDNPHSTPMSFWTEQDVLQYIIENNIEIASVYGDIVQDDKGKYKTTGRHRTGCIFCGFGCHLEKEPNRFQQLKETHPKLYDYCINGGEYNEDGTWQPSIDGLGLSHVLDTIGVKY